nr:MAG TPA: hypothetical protein [Bacteriophage sp.]
MIQLYLMKTLIVSQLNKLILNGKQFLLKING